MKTRLGKIKLALENRIRQRREQRRYRKWIEKNRLTESIRRLLKREAEELSQKPLISILLPVYNIEEKFLRRCLESVRAQIYENWELCVADDASPAPHVRRTLEEYARKDARIKVVFRRENGHISAASNSALEAATGDFCGLLDHDDELAPDALFFVAREINRFPETDFIYSDEDMIDERGGRFFPKFKPDFARDFFYSVNYVTHFAVYRTAILRRIGGFRIGFEGSQDYDLALRFIEQTDEKRIRHIPQILYHWRAIRGSVALSSDEKPYAHERARAALREHFQRIGVKASVERGIYELHRVRYQLPENPPRVSLILSADDDSKIAEKVARVLKETDYRNLETILICSGESRNLSFAGNAKVIFRGNLSKADCLNRAVSESSGEILCFAGADLLPLSNDWMKELASFAMQNEIGAVGGKILDARAGIADGGLIAGFEGTVGSAFCGLAREADGNLFRARVINNFSAISLSSLTTRRELFENLGGFDAENLPEALFDADYCLRLRAKNLRVVWTPYAELIQTKKRERRAKPNAAEREFFSRKWQNVIERDPFYNPNLSLSGETFTIKV